MKRIFLIVLIVFANIIFVKSQTTQSVIAEVNADTLYKSLKILTSESPWLDNIKIPNRYTRDGAFWTSYYLKYTLSSFGLETEYHHYSQKGKNVIATQKGTIYPDSIYIICAHFDSVDEYCADDNASGTSTVIEAARILSKYKFDYTIKYALWDEEELGLIGSKQYAEEAFHNKINIVGVINLDMIGYDGNNDFVFDTYFAKKDRDAHLVEKLKNVLTENNFDLDPIYINEEFSRSDNYFFSKYGFPTLFISESSISNDFNPYYHTSGDRISKMSLEYHHQLSQLAIGTLFELANLDTNNLVNTPEKYSIEITQNSTNDFITLTKNSMEFKINNIRLYNLNGKEVYYSEDDLYQQKINISNLERGAYFLVIYTSSRIFTKKIINF